MILSDTPQAPGAFRRPVASHRRARNRAFIAANTGPANAALPTWCGSKPWFMAEAIVRLGSGKKRHRARSNSARRLEALAISLRGNARSWAAHYPGAATGRIASVTSPSRVSLPRYGGRVGLRIVLACCRGSEMSNQLRASLERPGSRGNRENSFTDLEGRRREKAARSCSHRNSGSRNNMQPPADLNGP